MQRLRQSTRCASDSFDQHFGIAASFNRPWAVKQGWSAYSAKGTCGPGAAPRPVRSPAPSLAPLGPRVST